MIFALSVQSFVDKVGAYVGFAAAIGLALFAMLLFAQARELKRLREWGAHAHDRIGELERRLAAALELARRASTSQRTMAPGAAAAQRPVPAKPLQAGRAAPAVARTSSPTRLPLLPAAPARVGGAALGSATVFVPLPKQPPGAVPAQAPAGAPAPTAAPVPTPPAPRPAAVPAAIPAAAAATAAAASSVPAAPATPAPATAAGQGPAQPAPVLPAPSPPPAATNGHSDTFPPVPPVRRAGPRPGARPAAGTRPPARGAARPGQRPVPAAPLRARSAPSASPRGGGNGNGGVEAPPHGRRRLALLLGGLGAVAVVAVAALLLTGGGDDSPSTPAASNTVPTRQTTGAARRTTPAAAAPAHDRVTVGVLNGTTTPGLASTVMSTLTSDAFVRGPVTNASDQQRSVTVVSYFGGHEAEAQEVAKTLDVPPDAVQPIDADTEAACAQGATCAATVVVTVGADRQ